MLFTCLPEGARIPGRFPGPAHARGKWFTIDIHCHVTSRRPTTMVEGNEAVVDAGRCETQANPRTPARSTGSRRCAPASRALRSRSDRRHGPDGDRHPGDLAGAAPDLLRRRSDLGIATARVDQRRDRRDRRPPSRPLRRSRHGAVPGAGTRGRRTRPAAPIARAARHRDHDACRRRGSVGRPLPQDLRTHRGTGAAGLHASRRLHRGAALQRPLLRQRDRQSARYDGGGASPDLRRRAGGLSEA